MKYGDALSTIARLLYYRFSNPVDLHEGRMLENPFATEFLQRAAPYLTALICDNQAIIDKDRRTLDATAGGYSLLPALLGDFEAPVRPVPPLQAGAERPPSKRLLWASRISREKRISLLGPLARALQSDLPGVVIECRGAGDESALGSERPDNLLFAGGFDHPLELQLENYDGFIYTSLYDGMPNIVVEALSQGATVVASNVGSIGHYIEHGVSGYLVEQTGDDVTDALRFAEAIKHMYQHWDVQGGLRIAAVASISAHDRDSYLRNTECLMQTIDSGRYRTRV